MYSHTYIIEVEHRDYNIYAIKFYLKSHRYSDNRYSLTLNQNQKDKNHSGAKNFLIILNTMMSLTKDILIKDSKASFGFIGAPIFSEMDFELNNDNINNDGTYKNTKRFRIYKAFVLRYFSPQRFEHIQFINSSAYLIRNKKNTLLTKQVSEEQLNDYLSNG